MIIAGKKFALIDFPLFSKEISICVFFLKLKAFPQSVMMTMLGH